MKDGQRETGTETGRRRRTRGAGRKERNGRRRFPVLPAFGVACCLALALTLFTLHRGLTDRDAWLDAAADTAPARSQRLTEALTEIARAYEVDPEPLLACFPPERAEALTRQGMAWLLAQWHSPAPEMPEIPLEGLRETLRAEGLPAGQARNAVTDVRRAAKRCLFPTRTTVTVQARAMLAGAGLEGNLTEAVRTARLVSAVGTWVFLAGAAAFGTVTLLRRTKRAAAWSCLGAGLAGGGLGALLIHLAVVMLNLPGRVGEVSPLLGGQAAAVQSWLLAPGLIAAGALLLTGAAMMIWLRDAIGTEINRVTWRDRSGALKAPLTAAFAADLHDKPFDDILPYLAGVDVILIAGDVTNRHSKKPPRYAERFLRTAAEIAPTYLSIGNHERRMPGAEEWRQVMETTGVTVLDDTLCRLRPDVVLGGLSSREETPDDGVVSALAQEGAFRLLLCHHPEYYDECVRGRDIDLTLSGHAHGGQVRIFGRGLFAPGQGLLPKLTSGLYFDGKLLVSRGLANHSWLPRVNDPCELILLTLLPAEKPAD